jgi:hypothetical protein
MMSDLLIAVGFSALFLLNVYQRAVITLMRRATRHVHEWTPWSDWRTLEGEDSRSLVTFLRVRYCAGCAQEERQEVGRHYCGDLNNFNVVASKRHCTHVALYTEIFDPMYELRQINKDLEELQ